LITQAKVTGLLVVGSGDYASAAGESGGDASRFELADMGDVRGREGVS
jgi:hypothetical protein